MALTQPRLQSGDLATTCREPSQRSAQEGTPRAYTPSAVTVIAEVVFMGVSAIEDMVDRSGVLHAQLSGHGRSLPVPHASVNTQTCGSAGLTPLRLSGGLE